MKTKGKVGRNTGLTASCAEMPRERRGSRGGLRRGMAPADEEEAAEPGARDGGDDQGDGIPIGAKVQVTAGEIADGAEAETDESVEQSVLHGTEWSEGGGDEAA